MHLHMILVFTMLLSNLRTTFTTNTTTEQRSLLAIKSQIIRDPNGVLASWNESAPFCQWQGVACGTKHRRVTSLDLSSQGLVGTLSPSIGNLTFLRFVLLYNNTFQGQIPSQVGHLSRLQTLDLSDNSFKGVIPNNLSHCVNLLKLGLSSNNLQGRIPRELGSLSKLQLLVIHENHFEGDLYTIGNITSLIVISATDNMFEGRIPDSFGKLKNLSNLYLGSNNISGNIPHSFYNLSSLTILFLPLNQLSGTLLPELGLRFPRLQELQINKNHFSGPLPVTLSNLSQIQIIHMSDNEFVGKVHFDGSFHSQLQYFNIAGNCLGQGQEEEGGLNFIQSLVNCSQLTKIVAGSNQIGGILPPSTANLSDSLNYLNIAWNNLSGQIPPGLGNLRKLRMLVLQFNLFTGVIPSDIGDIQTLETFSLTSNRFHGTIPSSLGNITKLSGLYLNGNFFEGEIPPSLGNCRYLNSLALDMNKLSGTLPDALFRARSLSRILIVSYNQLEGSVPATVGELTNLALMDISHNKLSGEVTRSLGSCISLEKLYMQGNFFSGAISSAFGDMKGLQVLDLSHNNLTGPVPGYFSSLSLVSLNISFNDLEGEVSKNGVFANATAVSLLGNSRLCGGILQLSLPKCSTGPNRRKHSHKVVLEAAIPCACGAALVLITLVLILLYGKGRTREPNSESSKDLILQISYNTLLKATNGFASTNLIGFGSFGRVYKGILEPDQEHVAVKVLDLKHQAALKSFLAECNALKNIRHRNLLRIITTCSSIDFQGNDFKALVYEFMPNGSLENMLHSSFRTDVETNETRSLSLLERITILIDVATALDYLHHGCPFPVIHCDLKPSNILLDSEMTARVGDFGLARVLYHQPHTHGNSSIGVRGTIGYTAPEYGLGSDPSSDGDIYSFGILLLETITGKRPTDQIFKEALNLHTYAKASMPNNILEIMDQRLADDFEYFGTNSSKIPPEAANGEQTEFLGSIVHVAVACSMEPPHDRMNLKTAIHELQSARSVLETRKRSRQRQPDNLVNSHF